jgi:general secretion pathway protein L
MSLLVLQIPPRPKLRAREAGSAAALPAEPVLGELGYAWSEDHRQLGRHGHCAPALLPKADTVVAVVSEADLSWHELVIPKAPPARLRAALAGVLEEALLDDAGQAHLAVGPQSVPGSTGWIAATHRGWLAGHLRALEQAQVFVDRVVPAQAPGGPPRGHFSLEAADGSGAEALRLSWADGRGAAVIGLRGNLGRSLLPSPLPETARFSASPAAIASAEAWLNAPVALVSEGERLLAAAQSPWNLRQFELVRRHRGSRVLRDGWRALLGPAWRPVRIGLAGLLVVQVLGLNLWALHLRQQLADKRQQSVAVLQTSFPQVRAVLDAPVQMEREVQRLRSQAGQAGENDLEPLLGAAAAAWPGERPPLDSLRYEPGRLSLGAAGWGPDEIAGFGARLRAAGYTVESSEGRLTIRRLARVGEPASGSPSSGRPS